MFWAKERFLNYSKKIKKTKDPGKFPRSSVTSQGKAERYRNLA